MSANGGELTFSVRDKEGEDCKSWYAILVEFMIGLANGEKNSTRWISKLSEIDSVAVLLKIHGNKFATHKLSFVPPSNKTKFSNIKLYSKLLKQVILHV